MSEYIQGTIVKLTYSVKDFDTGQYVDPPDTSVTIADRAGTKNTLTLSAEEIYHLDVGKFRAAVDTSNLIGGVVYEITSLGPNQVSVRGEFNVIAKVGP